MYYMYSQNDMGGGIYMHACAPKKIRFPKCPVYKNMLFPHISYTCLAEDRAEFLHMNEMCRKLCPILLIQISYMYEIFWFIRFLGASLAAV